ncbi:hypothetical protein D3C86_1326190 [compost metagenome]
MWQFRFQKFRQQTAGTAVDALGAGDNDRVISQIRTIVTGRIGMGLRRHGEEHNAGTCKHIRLGRKFKRIRKVDTRQGRLVHAIAPEVSHQGRIAAEQGHIMPVFQRNDDG